MRYAEVLILKKFPRNSGIFDYGVPENFNLCVGRVVAVPFRKNETIGIVIKIKSFSSQPIVKKIIDRSVFRDVIYSPRYIDFLLHTSRAYAVSPSLIFSMAFPEVIRRKTGLKKSNVNLLGTRHIDYFPHPLGEITEWKKRVVWEKKEHFFYYKFFQERLAFYLSCIKDCLAHGRQIAFFVPEIQDIYFIGSYLKKQWNESVVLWHGKLTKCEAHDSWEKIATGKARIIIGTPFSVFLPFRNLALAVIDDEHSPFHKNNEHNPRFSTAGVLRLKSKFEGCSLLFSSHAPLVASYSKVQSKSSIFIKPKKISPRNSLRIVDLRDEFSKQGAFSFLTDISVSFIQSAMEKKGRVFIFFNHKGFSKSYRCLDCGHDVLCGQCHDIVRPRMNSSAESLTLECVRCEKQYPVPSHCAHCGGGRIVSKGYGIQRMITDMRKIFPGVSILQIDSTSKIQDNAVSPIVIGTEYAFKRVNWNSFSTVISLLSDGYASARSWRSTEMWYSIISDLVMRSDSSRNVHDIILQTFHVDAPWIQSILRRDYEFFYREEIAYRKRFHYPPFQQCIRLLCYARSADQARAIQSKVLDRLSRDKIQQIGYIHAFPEIEKRSKKFYSYIILKIPMNQDIDFSWLPEQCFVDRDAEIFSQ